jgi:thiol-disulfide isomerase/thioredoxin
MLRTTILLLLVILNLPAKAQPTGNPVAIGSPGFDKYFFHHPAPVVHGRIINATEQELAAINASYILVMPTAGLQQPPVSIKIKRDGTFIFRLDYALPYQQIWLTVGNYFYTGLYANTDLVLELDLTKLKKQGVQFYGDGVKYEGTDGQLNDFMNRAIVYNRPQQLSLSQKTNSLQTNKADYLKSLDSLFAEQKKINDDFLKLNPSPYSWILDNELTSDYYAKVLHYAMQKAGAEPADWGKMQAHKIYLVSNSGIMFINSLYTYSRYFKLHTFNDSDFLKETRGLDSLFGSARADLLKMQMHSENAEENKAILDYLISSIQSRWCKAILSKKYQESVVRVQNVNNILKQAIVINPDSTLGTPVAYFPFGASLSSVNNMEPAEFISRLKTMYPGKALVIDFWATWCMPCLGAMPYSLSLSKQAANLPVKFIYLCTSQQSSQELWKSKIADLKQTGTHIFVDRQLIGKLMNLFGKSVFPSYVLINSSGQLAKEDIQSISSVKIDDLRKWINEE